MQGRSGMEGMGLGWNQETSRRGLGEEEDLVSEGRVVGRGWGGEPWFATTANFCGVNALALG